MPIRLNLLAEVQAAEEMRRRDPVKRAIWVGGFLVAGMLGWAAWVQGQTMIASGELSRVGREIAQRTNDYRQILDNQKKSADVKLKLTKLRQLATNRFLNGNLLNALQQATLENVELTHVKVEQSYFPTDEVKPKTNSEGRIILGKPATVRESIVLTIEAKDSSPDPGSLPNPFKEVISTNAFFQAMLGRTNEVRLADVKPLTPVPDGRPYKLFTLECRFPEKTR